LWRRVIVGGENENTGCQTGGWEGLALKAIVLRTSNLSRTDGWGNTGEPNSALVRIGLISFRPTNRWFGTGSWQIDVDRSTGVSCLCSTLSGEDGVHSCFIYSVVMKLLLMFVYRGFLW
jgi:hypothetical protein